MKRDRKFLFTLIALAVIALNSCTRSPNSTATLQSPTATMMLPTQTSPPRPDHSLQLENDLPVTLLVAKRSEDLTDNHIGIHTESYDRYSDTELVYRSGFKWIRIQSLTEFWGEGDDLLVFDLKTIPMHVDHTISEYRDNGVNIVLDLWMGAGLVPYGTTFQSKDEIEQYLDYVKFVVTHFQGRIEYYQIWNEPGHIIVSDYANLVARVVPVIRKADPAAKIIIGGTQGNWDNGHPGYSEYQRFSVDMVYLNALLGSGVVHLADGISWHPFYDNIPNDSYVQNYPHMVQGIKDLAAANGFSGEYFADELLWRTKSEEGWEGGPPVSRQIGAKYYTRAIVMHRGMDVNVTINTFFQEPFLAPIHNLCDMLAGAVPIALELSLENEPENLAVNAFTLPDGEILIALWTNGSAVENDLGNSTTLTITSTSAHRVIGVDIFNGIEQELIIDSHNSNLVIPNLLVKDYPIIIKLTNITP